MNFWEHESDPETEELIPAYPWTYQDVYDYDRLAETVEQAAQYVTMLSRNLYPSLLKVNR